MSEARNALAHPTDSLLERFLNQQLSTEENALIGQHVNHCKFCQSRLDDMQGSLSSAEQVLLGAMSGNSEDTPPQVEGYIVGTRLDAGGMGVVWRVRDLSLNRVLAMKVIQAHLSGKPGPEQRFRNEATQCSRLTHPCIVPIHEQGETTDGRLYYTMKLVDGQTLAELLRKRAIVTERLSELLGVFAQVCQAIGYAHSQDVLHRDLKPHNVMVGEHGEVQVMDWGLNKDLSHSTAVVETEQPACLTDTQHEMKASTDPGTAIGMAIGTWPYMPPECANGKVNEVDRRSDVFGLGAILCEILTGEPPYIGSEDEMKKQAKEGDLNSAFARLDASGADPELIALTRRCLAPEKGVRFADGAAVAAAVVAYTSGVQERFQAAKVEKARGLVQAEEQRKRRRLQRVGVAVVIGVLLAGVVGTTIGMIQANSAATAAKSANERTQKRLEQIEKGIGVLASLVEGINPRNEEKGGPPVYELLAERASKAADELDVEAVGDALAVARLQTILGTTLYELGNVPKAIAVLEKARATRQRLLAADHPDTLTTLHNLALVYRDAGRVPEAIQLCEQVRDAQVNNRGANHSDTHALLNNLAKAYQDAGRVPEAIQLIEQVRDAQVKSHGPNHPDTLETLDNLADAYRAAGKPREAFKLLEQVRDARTKQKGHDHLSTLTTLNNLALAYQYADRVADAIPLFKQVSDVRAKKLGPDHPSTLHTLNNLAGAYEDAGNVPEAINLYEQVRDARVKKLSAEHPETLTTLNNLALAYRAAGRVPEAIQLFEQLRDAQVKKLEADHPRILSTLNNLAQAYQDAGQLDKALLLFEQVVRGLEKRNFLHPATDYILSNTSFAYEQAGQLAKAEAWRRKCLTFVKERAGAGSPSYAAELAWLGLNLLQQKKWAEAEIPLRESLAVREKIAPDCWTTFRTKALLGGTLLAQKKHADAEPLLLGGYQGMKNREKSIPPQGKVRLIEAIDRLIEFYTATDKFDDVKKWQTERNAIIKKQTVPEKK